uniref:Uncharacterized protein n=1 Tax=viral metagenome TaxID=1070528 RepID=A0A2V0RAG3_9ZZZZ
MAAAANHPKFYDAIEMSKGNIDILDSNLGKVAVGGPPGKFLTCITYEQNAANGTTVHGLFRPTTACRGIVSSSTTSTRTNLFINEDQEGGAGIVSDARKLRAGAEVVFFTLMAMDERRIEDKGGSVAVGHLPVKTSAQGSTLFGVASPGSDSAVLTSTSADVLTASASAITTVCAHPQCIYTNPIIFDPDATVDDISAAALSMVYDGVEASAAGSVKFKLKIYAFQGPISSGLNTNLSPDHSFNYGDLAGWHAPHPYSVAFRTT